MSKSDATKNTLPPYISLITLKGFVQKLKETTVPDRIDSSVLTNYAGSTAAQLVAALRYLKLIQENGDTTPALTKLVNTMDTSAWQEAMKAVMIPAFEPIVKNIKLESATPGMLTERFREWGAQGQVLEKTVRFFENAMTESGVALSPLILNKPRARPDRTKTKNKKQKGSTDWDDDMDTGEDAEAEQVQGKAGRVKFAIPIPGKGTALLSIPADLAEEDCAMIDVMVKAYVKRQQKVGQNTGEKAGE